MDDDTRTGRNIAIGAAVVAIGVATWWYLRPPPAADIDPPPPQRTAPPAPEQSGPLYPLPPVDEVDRPADVVELPPLADSDSYFSLALTDLFGPGLGDYLVDEALVEKVVATIDNLPRRRVAERIRPVSRLATGFAVDEQAETGFTIAAGNAERYRPLVMLLARSDPDDVYATYVRFYPLMQDAYVDLGYPEGYFNDRVVEVIDHLLATPQPDGPLELVRPNVLYEYADPELEGLSAGQKLLLRMGSENAGHVRRALRELRERIVVASEAERDDGDGSDGDGADRD